MVYNEVIDVLRAIYFIAKKRLDPANEKEGINRYGSIPNLFDNPDDSEIKYLVDKSLIIQAWKRYRPNESDFMERREVDTTTSVASNKNFISVVGRQLIEKIIDNINQNNDKGEIDEDNTEDSYSSSENTDFEENIPLDEVQTVDIFLSRFLLSSESKQQEIINLKLALKALPKKITDYNEPKIKLLDFASIQFSLIAFQNDDQDELFNFYDRRNGRRLLKLRMKAKENNPEIEFLDLISKRLLFKAKQLFVQEQKNPSDPYNTSLGTNKNHFLKSDTVSEF
jgi:hypothetical protein